MQITNNMICIAYDVGTRIYFSKMSRTEGSVEISKLTGMNLVSASDYITVLLAMLNGECYKRTINLMATKYYLENIGCDFGIESQRKAAKATLEHVAYYKSIHGYLKVSKH